MIKSETEVECDKLYMRRYNTLQGRVCVCVCVCVCVDDLCIVGHLAASLVSIH